MIHYSPGIPEADKEKLKHTHGAVDRVGARGSLPPPGPQGPGDGADPCRRHVAGQGFLMLEIAVLQPTISPGRRIPGSSSSRCSPESLLISADRLDSDDLDPLPQMLAAQTDSRALAADAARARIVQTAAKLERLGPKRVFKKVDSCMRGNVGAEVDGVVEAMGFEVSLIAPAFPEVGRTTVHDVHLVHGTAGRRIRNGPRPGDAGHPVQADRTGRRGQPSSGRPGGPRRRRARSRRHPGGNRGAHGRGCAPYHVRT